MWVGDGVHVARSGNSADRRSGDARRRRSSVCRAKAGAGPNRGSAWFRMKCRNSSPGRRIPCPGALARRQRWSPRRREKQQRTAAGPGSSAKVTSISISFAGPSLRRGSASRESSPPKFPDDTSRSRARSVDGDLAAAGEVVERQKIGSAVDADDGVPSSEQAQVPVRRITPRRRRIIVSCEMFLGFESFSAKCGNPRITARHAKSRRSDHFVEEMTIRRAWETGRLRGVPLFYSCVRNVRAGVR